MRAIVAQKMREADGLRGLVPNRKNGRLDSVYKEYLESLNVREDNAIQERMAMSEDPRFQAFLDRILRPQFKKVALPTIAKACNISLLEFSNWWNRESAQAAIAKAQSGSVRIVEDMVEDAKTVEVVCDRCDGLTWIAAPDGLPSETPGYRFMRGEDGEIRWIRDCPNCSGGKVRRVGDSHSREKTLEIAGVLKKGGPAVVINQNMGAISHSSAVGDLSVMDTFDVEFEAGK